MERDSGESRDRDPYKPDVDYLAYVPNAPEMSSWVD